MLLGDSKSLCRLDDLGMGESVRDVGLRNTFGLALPPGELNVVEAGEVTAGLVTAVGG